jgi:hypothetical protein
MRDLSLKGIARQYRAKSGAVSVRRDIIGHTSLIQTTSVRERLEELASRDVFFRVSECVYVWTAIYQQVWTHIVVRIKLDPDDGIADATMESLRTTWAEGVATAWSDLWGCGRSGELTCPLTFEVQWVDDTPPGQPRQPVRVVAGSGRANMGTWYTNSSGRTAAHEVGHMFGHPDEYGDAACPDRDPVNTGSIMHRSADGDIPQRLMTRFASNISSSVVGI